MRKWLFIFALVIFLAGCTGWLYSMPTGAMIPTIKVGDKFTVNRFAYGADTPIERFDIVIYNAPEAVTKMSGDQIGTVFCKRIVGLPGERIEIIKGLVYINGKLLEETFEKISGDDKFPPLVVPLGEYYVLGDNRPNSLDSRYKEHSTVKRTDVLGKVMQIYSK